MAKAKNATSKTLGLILLGLLIFSLLGFGVTNFSGNARDIGEVGTAKLDIDDYFRNIQSEIRAVEAEAGERVTFQQAQAQGLPDAVLARMVVTAALEHEAFDLGISVGDERLAQDIRNIQAFQGSDGSFNREAYAFTLQNAGMNEREFEEDIRAESAATILQGAVLSGTVLPDTYVTTLVNYAAERRNVTWVELGPDRLSTPLADPSDEDLRQWYEANIDRFTRPETRAITYVWVTPEMIVDSVEVDDETLRAAYAERTAEFNQPERRLVERLVFADDAAAQGALDRLTAGELSFEDLVLERGLELADVDMGDVARSDLGAAADAVFAAQAGDLAGPAPTALGPALFRVNAILAAQETPFEEAEPQLRDELALDRARRVIEAQAQGYDDELAAGATLEELAGSTDLQLGQIGWTGAESEGPAAYNAFREAATAMGDGDFPQITSLDDGGVFALRLDDIQPPAPIPLDEVRDRVVQGWTLEAQSAALAAEAETLAARLGEGLTFAALDLQPRTETDLSRNAFTTDLPQGMVQAAFEMSEGETRVLPGQGTGTALLVRLDAITAPDLEGEQAQLLTRLFADQAAQDVAQDLFQALAADIQTRAGVEIDQAARNAVHANFQ